MVEPPVDNPQLRALVELARKQPDPIVRTTVDDVRRGVQREQASARRGWVYGGVLAAAASLLAWFAVGPASSNRATSERDGVAAERTVDERARGGEADVVDGARGGAKAVGTSRAITPQLVPEDTPTPEGDAAADASADAEDASPGQDAFAEEATAPDAADDHGAAEPTPSVDRPSAAELSREAEAALASGDRNEAIRILTKLVRMYPRAAQTGAGLVDLGRLLRQSGRNDRARCAYETYLARFPSAALRPEVEHALTKLGAGPKCRGLRPQ